MKKCTKCGLNKNLSAFYQRRNDRIGEYFDKCRECHKAGERLYYQKTRERQCLLKKLRHEKYKHERKQWLKTIKDRPCLDCGIKFPPYVMEFDHRDGTKKVYNIAWMVNNYVSKFEKIKLEIAKCDLVCVNCHRQRTHFRLKNKNAAVANVVKALV